jgi:hypothetical protein
LSRTRRLTETRSRRSPSRSRPSPSARRGSTSPPAPTRPTRESHSRSSFPKGSRCSGQERGRRTSKAAGRTPSLGPLCRKTRRRLSSATRTSRQRSRASR